MCQATGDTGATARAERVAATSKALDDGAPAIFEATFIAEDTFVAIDVLEQQGEGHRLIEVKASNSQKDEHIPDVAVQAYIAAMPGCRGGTVIAATPRFGGLPEPAASARITALPGPSAVTTPVESTRATFTLLDDHT